jgi:DNA-binding transcriptional regulator YhcF (GntR family)
MPCSEQIPPRIAHACAWLESLIERPELLPEGKLAPVRTLAAEAGVALVTMHKAVHLLCDDGRLTAVKGKGVWLRGAAPPALTRPPRPYVEPKWQRIRRELLSRIHSGFYPHNKPFPSLGVLREELGASYRTLRKALTELEGMGVITPYGRTFRPVPVGAPRSGAAVLIVTMEDGHRHPSITSRRDEVLLGSLEQGCTQSGLEPAMVGLLDNAYSLSSAQALKQFMAAVERRRPILGAVVRGAFIQSLESLLEYLLSLRLPVAVLDEFGDLSPELRSRYAGRLAVFNISYTMSAGLAAGLSLARHGHRHAAYFTNFSQDAWSVNRFHAIRKGFCGGRTGANVDFYATPARSYEEFLDSIGGASICTLGAGARASLPDRAEERYADQLKHFTIREFNRSRYEELFRRALDTPATAWACDNDIAGLAALDFLQSRNVRVPEEIAVMGFDNTAGALKEGLTSYEFAIPRVADMIIRYVAERKTTGAAGEEVTGYIVERRSTSASRRP